MTQILADLDIDGIPMLTVWNKVRRARPRSHMCNERRLGRGQRPLSQSVAAVRPCGASPGVSCTLVWRPVPRGLLVVTVLCWLLYDEIQDLCAALSPHDPRWGASERATQGGRQVRGERVAAAHTLGVGPRSSAAALEQHTLIREAPGPTAPSIAWHRSLEARSPAWAAWMLFEWVRGRAQVDACADPEVIRRVAADRPDTVALSAVQDDCVPALQAAVEAALQSSMTVAEIFVPYGEARPWDPP